MTYGGDTYGGASIGSNSTADTGEAAVATAQSTTTTTATATGTGSALSTASATSAATALVANSAGATTALASAQTAVSAVTSPGETTATASSQTTAGTIATDATLIQSDVEWRVTVDNTEVINTVFDVDPVVDTANPFGDYAVAKMDDRGGQLFDKFPRGTRVDIAVSTNQGITFENRFTGYVVERRENEQSGADVLEVEAYSFDQFLRRNTVTNDQTGNTITQALQDIIETDTPVTFVAGNVDVGDDQELRRSYRGVSVENTLRDLAFKSNNEDFGVNDSLEFFFRERETTHIDRGIDNTQWFNYDIPELGKEAINEVEVWFSDGDESVIVDDGTDKLDLQDSLGLADPGTQRAELNRPLISNINDAEDIGRKYLAFRNSTLSGTVTTFGLFDAEPGDTIDVTIDSRGIGEEFVIASTEYRWGVDETILTIVEQRGNVDDILTELNDSVQRVEMEGADRDAPKNRITSTNSTGIVSVTVDADGNTPTGDRFVNDGRRAVRDTWTGEAAPDIKTLVVGDDGSGLSRSNTALGNQTNSAAVSQSLPDAKSVEFSASITQTGVEEVGLEAADGTLITRATFDTAVDLSGTVTVTLAVSNDDSVSRGVLTDAGQTSVRDVLADNSPALPNQYAYGSDDTPVAETDTALGNELVSVSLTEILIQDADAGSEWDSITSDIADDIPLIIDSTNLRVTQTAFTAEAEGLNTNSAVEDLNTNYSDGIARGLSDLGDFVEHTFTPEHDIAPADFDWHYRINTTSGVAPEVEFSVNGKVIESTKYDVNISWQTANDSNPANTLSAGEQVTCRAEVVESGVNEVLYIDVSAPLDNRYPYNFDNTTNTNDGYLDGPELFPDVITKQLDTAETRRNVTEANFELVANDVTNNFAVELANDGSTFTAVNNSQTGSVTFASPNRGVDTKLSLGRGSNTRNTATPRTGFTGQSVDSWDLFANPDAVLSDNIGETLTRAVVAPGTITGSTVREAGAKSGSTLLTRHILADFTVEANQRISSAETTLFTSDN